MVLIRKKVTFGEKKMQQTTIKPANLPSTQRVTCTYKTADSDRVLIAGRLWSVKQANSFVFSLELD